MAWARDGSDLHQPGLGIAFEELTASDRDAILAFVRERPALFYDIDAGSDAESERRWKRPPRPSLRFG